MRTPSLFTIFRHYFRLQAPPQGDLETADAFIGLAFGLGPGDTAGASNRALAQWLIQNNPKGKPALVQMGIGRGFCELGERPDWLTVLPHSDQIYVTTHGAMLQSWSWLERQRVQRLALVAHPHHSQRVAWIFQPLPDIDLILPQLPAIPYDPNSTQPWTRSRRRYALHELLRVRPHLVLMGR